MWEIGSHGRFSAGRKRMKSRFRHMKAENGEQNKLRPGRRERGWRQRGRLGGQRAGFRLPFLHICSASSPSQAVSGLDIAHKWTIGAPFICSLILSVIFLSMPAVFQLHRWVGAGAAEWSKARVPPPKDACEWGQTPHKCPFIFALSFTEIILSCT